MSAEQELENRVEELERQNLELRQQVHGYEHLICSTLAPYVSSEVLQEIILHDGEPRAGGERREVTMMFTDIRGSTELAERMDPIDYIRMLNHYFSEMAFIADSWQGTILEYVGDAIVVVFGAPRQNPSAPVNAVYSAVAMQRRMPTVNEWNGTHGFPPLQMGIGIHTGEALVGSIGSEARMKYDVIGRNMNLASRIEGFTRGGQILVSSATLRATGDVIHENVAGTVRARPKGVSHDITMHDIVGIGSIYVPGWEQASH